MKVRTEYTNSHRWQPCILHAIYSCYSTFKKTCSYHIKDNFEFEGNLLIKIPLLRKIKLKKKILILKTKSIISTF